MPEPRAEPTSAAAGWRRERFYVALVGPEAVRHHELLARAGYRVRSAADGMAASELFVPDAPLDAIVVDFALSGRPPEAILLFARRANAAAPMVAVVSAHDSDAYRRAFHAGARDVLPAPARGEDLVAAVDLVLEPRALAEALERLRSALGVDDEATPLATTPDGSASQVGALEGEIARLRRDLEEMRSRQRDEGGRLRQQALDAITERDRALESREAANQRLTQARRELKERDDQLRMVERACEELQRKLKDARDQRRLIEGRLAEAESRVGALEARLAGRPEKARRAAGPLDEPTFDERSLSQSGEHRVVDPEEALVGRAEDEQRLAALDGALREKARLEERVQHLESVLAQDNGFYAQRETLPEAADPGELERFLSRRAEDEKRLAELDELLRQRQELLEKVQRLQDSLRGQDAYVARIDELERLLAEREARLRQLEDSRPMPVAFGATEAALEAELAQLKDRHAEALGVLDAVRIEREGLRRRVKDLEREAADALMRVDELAPLAAEVEHLRGQLSRLEEVLEDSRSRAELAVLERATLEDQLAARQRELVLAYAQREALSASIQTLKDQLVSLLQGRDEARQQIRALEAELEALRVHVASLASKRLLSPP